MIKYMLFGLSLLIVLIIAACAPVEEVSFEEALNADDAAIAGQAATYAANPCQSGLVISCTESGNTITVRLWIRGIRTTFTESDTCVGVGGNTYRDLSCPSPTRYRICRTVCNAPQQCTSTGCAIPESCDGSDNDGDGSVDEGCDDDNDGYCDGSMSRSSTLECGYSWSPDTTNQCCPYDDLDCNDADNTIYPILGREIVCGDGLDNNCDGEIDDGCES